MKLPDVSIKLFLQNYPGFRGSSVLEYARGNRKAAGEFHEARSSRVVCRIVGTGACGGGKSAPKCADCPTGKYCEGGLKPPIPCPAGFYCPAWAPGKNAKFPCEGNTYNDKEGQSSPDACEECGGFKKPNADHSACVDDADSLGAKYAAVKAELDGKKGVKGAGSVELGPGTYMYELSGAGGGGGGGGSSRSGCTSKNNGGHGGNGELKSGSFTLAAATTVEYSIGGNVSGAGDCGYGGSDDGAPGEASWIKYGSITITALGGGGGQWTKAPIRSSPSGFGAAGGLGGQQGGRNPQNGAAGWFILTGYAPQ